VGPPSPYDEKMRAVVSRQDNHKRPDAPVVPRPPGFAALVDPERGGFGAFSDLP